MKLTRPLFNEIRFDRDMALLKELGVNTRTEYTIAIGQGDLTYPYYFKFKIRVIMYTDTLHNEIAGYTAEAQSAIIEKGDPQKDIAVVQIFLTDIFSRCKKSLTEKLPEFNLNYLQPPHYQELSEKLIDSLIDLGFYR